MRFFRAMALLAFSAGLLVVPTPTASAAVICPENGGDPFTLTLNGAPTPAGTVGVAYNQVLTTGAAIALVITGGTIAPGLSASVTGAFGDEIQISGTPSSAGSFNATVEIVHATQTVTCSWTFVVNAGGGGGGGFVEPTLTVGDPVKGGEFVDSKSITCSASTFSVTPSRIRIYFTKNGVEIPDDAGTNVTSIDVPSTPGSAALVLTEDLLDSTIGCTVYAKSGNSEKTATTSWGLLTAEPRIIRVMEIFEDVLRNGGVGVFDNPAVADQVSDGFVGGKFTISGRSLSSFTFTVVKADGRTPNQTPSASERAVTVTSRTNTKATLQLPEITALGSYLLIARTPSKVVSIPVRVPKPIVTIANAKALLKQNKFLLEGDKVYANTYTTTSDITPVSTSMVSIFKKEFPKGFKVAFTKNSYTLTEETLATLRQLAKLKLIEVTITGFGFKGGTIKENRELSLLRANVIARTLTSAGMKNAKVIIQTEPFDTKYSRQATVAIR